MQDRIISAGGLRPHRAVSTQPLVGDRTTVCHEIISFHILIPKQIQLNRVPTLLIGAFMCTVDVLFSRAHSSVC